MTYYINSLQHNLVLTFRYICYTAKNQLLELLDLNKASIYVHQSVYILYQS